MKRNISKFQLAFTLIELLVVISIIAILASIALPTFTKVIEKGNQTKDLSNAKQIYLGLKMYAGDYDGVFPESDVSANAAFRQLIPNYVPTEKVFYLAKSAWTPRPPDENMTDDATKLAAGENHFAYVNKLTDTSNPNFPIIADGFSTTLGQYTTDETAVGGVWKGRNAIVVRVDGSGKVENCDSTTYKVMGPTGAAANADIFATSANWLAATQVPVNPLTPAP